MSTRQPSHVIPRFQQLLKYLDRLIACQSLFVVEIFVLLLIMINSAQAATPADPLEPINRPILHFNSAMDALVFKPLGKTYQQLMPAAARKGFGNMLNNLNDIQVIASDLLQLKFKQGFSDLGRFTVNSTLGVAGLFDVATTKFGLQKNDEDFGTALAHWNIGSGPYMVLPIIGPTTLRESIAQSLGSQIPVNPILESRNSEVRDKLIILGIAHARAKYLPLDDLVIGDKYIFVRDMYLQNLNYRNGEHTLDVSFSEF